jgi:hypothetical protein
VGAAARQTDRFVAAVAELAARYPEAATYVPEDVI